MGYFHKSAADTLEYKMATNLLFWRQKVCYPAFTCDLSQHVGADISQLHPDILFSSHNDQLLEVTTRRGGVGMSSIIECKNIKKKTYDLKSNLKRLFVITLHNVNTSEVSSKQPSICDDTPVSKQEHRVSLDVHCHPHRKKEFQTNKRTLGLWECLNWI